MNVSTLSDFMRDHDLTQFKWGNEIVQSGHDLTKIREQIMKQGHNVTNSENNITWPQINTPWELILNSWQQYLVFLSHVMCGALYSIV